jgi:hypothetical protein
MPVQVRPLPYVVTPLASAFTHQQVPDSERTAAPKTDSVAANATEVGPVEAPDVKWIERSNPESVLEPSLATCDDSRICLLTC